MGSERLVVKEFPANDKLNELFPDRPVLITRIDGHAAIANNKALEIASVKPGDKLEGGEIEVKNGKLTGILVDNAVDLVSAKFPLPMKRRQKKHCCLHKKIVLPRGLTSVHDCGLDHGDVEKIQKLQQSGDLKDADVCDAERCKRILNGPLQTEK